MNPRHDTMQRYATVLGVLLVVAGAAGVVAADEGPLTAAGLDQEVGVNTTVQLDGTGSSHPDGRIDGYEWSIETPDGRTMTPDCPDCARTTFTPRTVGRYNVTLTVTDANGRTDNDTLYVHVEKAGPTVELSGDTDPAVDDPTPYDASAETRDADIETLTWKLGNRMIAREPMAAPATASPDVDVPADAPVASLVYLPDVDNPDVDNSNVDSPGTGGSAPGDTGNSTEDMVEVQVSGDNNGEEIEEKVWIEPALTRWTTHPETGIVPENLEIGYGVSNRFDAADFASTDHSGDAGSSTNSVAASRITGSPRLTGLTGGGGSGGSSGGSGGSSGGGSYDGGSSLTRGGVGVV